MLPWISVLAGITLNVLAVRDIFHTLLTPTGRGSITGWLMDLTWRLAGPMVNRRHHYREIVGPLMFLGVIITWTVLIVLGWALIYWPFLPDNFLVDFGLDFERGSRDNFLTSIYLSLVVLGTLGFGDIVPTDEWLRLLVPLQALLGFGLITAGISWFLSIDPALARRRRLAHQIALVRDADEEFGQVWQQDTMVGLMDSFATQIIQLRSDQLQFPIMYYFRDADPWAELIPNLHYLHDMASWAHGEFSEESDAVRLHQYMLHRSIDDYVLTIAEQFFGESIDDLEGTLDRLARDHL